MCGQANLEQQTAFDLYVKALEATIAKAKAGRDDGAGTNHAWSVQSRRALAPISLDHQFMVWGLNLKSHPCRQAMPFFTARKHQRHLESTNVVIAIGNCGLYMGPWGVREGAVVSVERTCCPYKLPPTIRKIGTCLV